MYSALLTTPHLFILPAKVVVFSKCALGGPSLVDLIGYRMIDNGLDVLGAILDLL